MNMKQFEAVEKVAQRVMHELHATADEDVDFGEPLRWLIHGGPGTGKTHIITAAIVKELFTKILKWNIGVEYHVVALQAVMAVLIDGDTIHHFVGKHAMRGTYQGWILLDEVSMCVLPVLAALDQLRLGGTKIATFGDWDQQEPVGNSWRGHPVEAQAFRESRIIQTLDY